MNSRQIVFVGALLAGHAASADAVQQMLEEYRQQGVTVTSEQAGKALWEREFPNRSDGNPRSCTSCHGSSPEKVGRHIRTGKFIAPMAANINGKRFSDTRKMKKWFKRNCKWTLGRECSTQEQADILTFLSGR